jgi:hypothetical protein
MPTASADKSDGPNRMMMAGQNGSKVFAYPRVLEVIKHFA